LNSKESSLRKRGAVTLPAQTPRHRKIRAIRAIRAIGAEGAVKTTRNIL